MLRALSVFLFAAAALLSQQSATRSAPNASAPASGRLAGVVFGQDTAGLTPSRRAAVLLFDQERGTQVSTLSDDEGRFAFDEVPPGRYKVAAGKSGFVRTFYGATRINQPGVSLVVEPGQQIETLRIVMPKGAVIAGQVVSASGGPAVGFMVSALQFVVSNGDRILAPPPLLRAAGVVLDVTTDERGDFRLFGLPPGRYAVKARRSSNASTGQRFAETYFGGTSDPNTAQMIAVGPGEDLEGTVILAQELTTARVQGTVISLGAQASTTLFLNPDGPFVNGIAPDANGSFQYREVPPGRYMLQARSVLPSSDAGRVPSVYWGQTPLVVDGRDVENVAVAMQPAYTVMGRVERSETGSPAPGVSVVLTALRPWQRLPPLKAPTDNTGTFSIHDATPGRYQVSVVPASTSSPVQTIESVTLGGTEVTDVPIALTSDGPKEIVIRTTTRTQDIRGTVTDARGQIVTDVGIIAVPATGALRVPGSRRVRLVFPDSTGTFALALPSGEYVLVAYSDPDPADLDDPSFLASLPMQSLRVTLAPGDHKQQDIHLSVAR